MRKMINYRDYLIQRLADRERAIVYLETTLEEYEKDGNTLAFLMGLRSVVQAQGGLDELARRADINPQDLLKVLSNNDKQDLDTLEGILNDLGDRLLGIEIKDESLDMKYTEVLNHLVHIIDYPNPHLNLVNASVTVESLSHAVPAVD